MRISFSFLSLLNSDYNYAIEKFLSLDKKGWIHFDVMDGNFVKKKTYDARLVNELNDGTFFSDVHLMVKNPSKYLEDYFKARTSQFTFHYEAVDKDSIEDLITKIHIFNMKAGISIKPGTDVRVLDPFLDKLDYILVMSVEPGKSGQKFIDSCLDKIKYLASKKKRKYLIGVDGGINEENAPLLKEAGADVIIVGSYLASHLNKETINNLK